MPFNQSRAHKLNDTAFLPAHSLHFNSPCVLGSQKGDLGEEGDTAEGCPCVLETNLEMQTSPMYNNRRVSNLWLLPTEGYCDQLIAVEVRWRIETTHWVELVNVTAVNITVAEVQTDYPPFPIAAASFLEPQISPCSCFFFKKNKEMPQFKCKVISAIGKGEEVDLRQEPVKYWAEFGEASNRHGSSGIEVGPRFI